MSEEILSSSVSFIFAVRTGQCLDPDHYFDLFKVIISYLQIIFYDNKLVTDKTLCDIRIATSYYDTQ
jgi:hypothetical protein